MMVIMLQYILLIPFSWTILSFLQYMDWGGTHSDESSIIILFNKEGLWYCVCFRHCWFGRAHLLAKFYLFIVHITGILFRRFHSIQITFFCCYFHRVGHTCILLYSNAIDDAFNITSQSIGFFDDLVEYWCSYSYLYWVLGSLFLSGISVGIGVATARANIHGGNQWWCCSLYYIYI